MKILALADLHMGAGAAYADDRLADQTKVLEQTAQIAYDQDVGLVLIAGDVFHRPRPTPATLLAFRKFADALAALEIPTVAITGNAAHDIETGDRPCALDLFESPWFRVSRRPELITSIPGVSIATLPSVPVSRLVARSESVGRELIFDQAAEALLAVAYELRAQADYEPSLPSGGRPATILIGHWSVSGASLPNGLLVDSLNEPILDLASLARVNYDAIVLGHIHKPQPLLVRGDTGGLTFYCGSPMNVDFGEPHEHGCWIIDTEAKTEFVPLKDRPFVTIDCDAEAISDALGEGDLENIAGIIDLTDAVVRVRYTATEEQHRRIDAAALKKAILDDGAHRVFQISATIVKQDRARVKGIDENLDPAAALATWTVANEISDGSGLLELLDRYSVTAP